MRHTQFLIEFKSEKTDEELQQMITRILDQFFWDSEFKTFQVSSREVNRGPNES